MKKATKFTAMVLGGVMLLGAAPMTTFAATEALDRIVANCEVEDLGETTKSFEIHVKDVADLEVINKEDFIIKNAVADHLGTIVTPKVTEMTIEGDKLTLEVEDFLMFKSEGSDEVDALEVECTSNEDLSFAFEDIDEILSPIADQFTDEEHNGLVYKLFSPKTEEKQPLVIWMHGRGDNGIQLRSAPNGVMYASEEMQKDHPAYVLAPQSDQSVTETRWTDEELENVIEVVNELIAEGKVDENRVYVVGHSMGGQGTWNMLRKAPDLFAAAVTIAPRVISEDAELEDLAELTELPVWLFHATSDPINLVSGSLDRYNKLIELGSETAKLTELSDEEMLAYGLGELSPFEYHASQIVVANSPEVTEWLFSQTKATEEMESEGATNHIEEVAEANNMPLVVGGVVILVGAIVGFLGFKKRK